jgi:ATP-binding cassette subfamily B protein
MLKNNIRQLSSYLGLYKANLVIVFLSLFTVAASLLCMGHVFRRLVDNGLGSNQAGEINHSIYLISLLIGIFAIGSFFRSYFINMVTEKVISRIRSETFENLLKIEIARFEELKVGDIISRLGSDTEQIGSLITNFLSFFVRNSVMLVGGIILMIWQSPKLSLLVIVSVPLMLVPLLRLSRRLRSLSRKVLDEQGHIAASVEESFAGIRTLHAYNRQEYSAKLFNQKISDYIKHAGKRLRLRSLFFALAIMIISGSITAVIWIGSMDIINGSMTSGQMLSFIYYAVVVGMSAGGIAELFNEIQNPLAALDRVMELKSIAVTTENLTGNLEPEDYRIKFDNVSFAYPSRPDIVILNNISFEIEAGKFTGIVGRSGSGKSTLIQLLLKFYTHLNGAISLGGREIKNLNTVQIRSKIAYVQQEPTIFAGTIRSNICFSRPEATDAEVERIAELCGITDFAGSFEAGLDTEIGEKGVRISGGQKQRIAIARSLLYKPEILLLDEATSAIDREGEKKLLGNLREELKNKTIISIAHRISSLETADNILLINEGRLDSSGTHSQLLQNSEIYNRLCSEQEVTSKQISKSYSHS